MPNPDLGNPATWTSCPVPVPAKDVITLAHGGGGTLTRRLVEDIFLKAFGANEAAQERHDGAILNLPAGSLAFTTDAHVVQPLFFPGGDIGKLAVCGTVNDLAMCGARPLSLSLAFIIEEGFSQETLRRLAESIAKAAQTAGVTVVTGDTKVVENGKGDGVYLATSGIGHVVRRVGPGLIRPGDAILISGDIGRHGVAVLSCREGLEFETTIESDCAPLAAPVLALLEAGVDVHCLRDLTRGGLATCLIELAESAQCSLEFHETKVPVLDEVRGACELLGLDPLYVANEGRFVAFVPEAEAAKALEILRGLDVSAGAACIGRVREKGRAGDVAAVGPAGVPRLLHMLTGEQLPRIC